MPRNFSYPDRALTTSTTEGTGDLTLSDTPVAGFAAINVADGTYIDYAAVAVDASGTPTGEQEVGLGIFHSGASKTLTRAVIYYSTNGGAHVDWPAGTRRVSVIVPARKVAGLKIIPYTGDDVFYVRTTGTTTGQGNDYPDPVTTLEIAFERMFDYDFNLTMGQRGATVDIGAGTFSTGGFNFNIPVHGQSSIVLTGGGSATTTVKFLQFSADKQCTIFVSDMTLTEGIVAGRNVSITLGADVVLSNGSGTYGIATDGGSLSVGSGTNVTTLSGNVSVGFLSWSGYVGIEEIDIPSGETVSEAFVKCTHRGDVEVIGLVKTGAGSVTGPRYLVERFGTIDATGMGSTIIPGSTGGSVASGGQYLP